MNGFVRIILDVTQTVRYAESKKAETFIIVKGKKGNTLLKQPIFLPSVEPVMTTSMPTPPKPTGNNGS